MILVAWACCRSDLGRSKIGWSVGPWIFHQVLYRLRYIQIPSAGLHFARCYLKGFLFHCCFLWFDSLSPSATKAYLSNQEAQANWRSFDHLTLQHTPHTPQSTLYDSIMPTIRQSLPCALSSKLLSKGSQKDPVSLCTSRSWHRPKSSRPRSRWIASDHQSSHGFSPQFIFHVSFQALWSARLSDQRMVRPWSLHRYRLCSRLLSRSLALALFGLRGGPVVLGPPVLSGAFANRSEK